MNNVKSIDDIEYVDVADLDCIYLSYDEPQKEEFWVKIKQIVPWAKRVDGVHGSDAAHKAAAAASETERFILIDGDNMPDPKFFNITLELTPKNINAQFRWRAKNFVNGLYYGNGGMSSWTRAFVNNMRTHENTDGSDQTNIEFCFDPLYWPMHDCWSTTYINYTPKQAWRAGFREGVKMCTRNGVVPPKGVPPGEHMWPRNRRNLSVWHTIGRDVENGFWALHGARCGTHYLLAREWDHTEVRDFHALDRLWELHKGDGEEVCREIGSELNSRYGFNLVELSPEQSTFFKQHIAAGWWNRGPMVREIDVIREQEGW